MCHHRRRTQYLSFAVVTVAVAAAVAFYNSMPSFCSNDKLRLVFEISKLCQSSCSDTIKNSNYITAPRLFPAFVNFVLSIITCWPFFLRTPLLFPFTKLLN